MAPESFGGSARCASVFLRDRAVSACRLPERHHGQSSCRSVGLTGSTGYLISAARSYQRLTIRARPPINSADRQNTVSGKQFNTRSFMAAGERAAVHFDSVVNPFCAVLYAYHQQLIPCSLISLRVGNDGSSRYGMLGRFHHTCGRHPTSQLRSSLCVRYQRLELSVMLRALADVL